VAAVDRHHIAAVAGEARLCGDHDGHAYPLTGPEPVMPADRVRTLADVLGGDLRFVEQSDNKARAEMNAALRAEYLHAFFRFSSDGMIDESTVLPTVADITGQAPRAFRQWALAHAAAFR
jgi:uncharacterized protein YbjT (DUF2867 family)